MASKEDCEILMNQGLPLARQILEQRGEFLPFASALRPNGDIIYLGAYDGREFRPLFGAHGDLMQALKETLVAGARRQEYAATALFYDVDFTAPGRNDKADAIAVSLDHRDGYSVVVVLPYKIDDGKAALGAPHAQAGDAEIFRQN